MKIAKLVVFAIVMLGMIFLYSPIISLIIYSLSLDPTNALPTSGLTLKWFAAFASQKGFVNSLWMSILIGGFATAISLPIGILASYSLARHEFIGKGLVNVFFLSPILVPGIIVGISLLMHFGALGIRDSFARLVIAHVVITLPYVIRGVLPSLYGFDRSFEEAAMSLGAAPIRTFFGVTLPLIRPGIVASTIFAFTMSFSNFTESIFLVTPSTTTLPVQIFSWIEHERDPTIAAGSVLIVIMTVVIITVLDRVAGLDKIVGGMRFR